MKEVMCMLPAHMHTHTSISDVCGLAERKRDYRSLSQCTPQKLLKSNEYIKS